MDSGDVWVLVLCSVLSAVGGYVGVYLSQKAKNLATKEDTAEITELIESVRNGYASEQASLKANLDFLVKTNSGLHEDVKVAIYHFWENAVTLLSLCEPTRREIDEERVPELSQMKRRIEKLEDDIELSCSRLYLLIEDEKVIDTTHEILQLCNKISGQFYLFLIDVEPQLEALADMNAKADNYAEMYRSEWNVIMTRERKFEEHVDTFRSKLDDSLDQFKAQAKAILKAERLS
jgi:hypothetical protein